MSNKDLELQQDCNAVIHELEKAISNIKAACIEPDIDTAEKASNGTLSTLMENMNRYGGKKNLAEQGRKFLAENAEQYTLRFTEAITGDIAQDIELCRIDGKGEAERVFALNMEDIYAQCAPVNIIKTLSHNADEITF